MIRAAILGDDDSLEQLILEAFEDQLLHATADHPPDVILVVVGRTLPELMVQRARCLCARAPIIALLPYDDAFLARRAVELGAAATISLSGGLAGINATVTEVVARAPRPTLSAISECSS